MLSRRFFIAAGCVAVLAGTEGACGSSHGADNVVVQQLIEAGVEIRPGLTVKLPPPSFPDGLDAAAQQRTLKEVATAPRLEQFLRNSHVTPFTLKMASVTDAEGRRLAQQVHLWFIVYGQLTTLRDENLLGQFAAGMARQPGEELEASVRALTVEELRPHQLTPSSAADRVEQWAYGDIPLLDRVLVSGVVHCLQTSTAESLLIGGVLDARLGRQAPWANLWRPVGRIGAKAPELGEPRPYSGFGGYLKATKLREPAGAILVEAHVVFHEPEDWFNGANQLRSKFPIAAQSQIRGFRRRVAAAEAEGPPATNQ